MSSTIVLRTIGLLITLICAATILLFVPTSAQLFAALLTLLLGASLLALAPESPRRPGY
ncbi:MAG: hypothetical protein M3R06_11250 [Chloroflexota bacterium]|nr:hypothetical protein [Chloroflexota bacterium]